MWGGARAEISPPSFLVRVGWGGSMCVYVCARQCVRVCVGVVGVPCTFSSHSLLPVSVPPSLFHVRHRMRAPAPHNMTSADYVRKNHSDSRSILIPFWCVAGQTRSLRSRQPRLQVYVWESTRASEREREVAYAKLMPSTQATNKVNRIYNIQGDHATTYARCLPVLTHTPSARHHIRGGQAGIPRGRSLTPCHMPLHMQRTTTPFNFGFG